MNEKYKSKVIKFSDHITTLLASSVPGSATVLELKKKKLLAWKFCLLKRQE